MTKTVGTSRKTVLQDDEKLSTRWMVELECEYCRGKIKRSIADILEAKIGKHQRECPFCKAKVSWKAGLLPKDTGIQTKT